MSPRFGFFKRKTPDYFHDKESQANSVHSVSNKELLEIVENEKKVLQKDLIDNLEPTRNLVLDCLNRLRKNADELEEQEIKAESPQFESLINTSKKILITSIKKESLIESYQIKSYEDAIKFKNNLELLINRFGQVGDSHNRILNEFMRKQINKLKSEFDNLSSLLKTVTKIISTKENQINSCIQCKADLILLNEKLNERRTKKVRLTELIKETQTIDKNIEEGKRQYEDLRKSEEFLNASKILEKIDEKKNEIVVFEKNMINKVSILSRPITKFSYQASKETQGKLATILNQPLEIFKDDFQYLQLFGELRKDVDNKSIQVKDPEKTIHQIDEIVNSLPALSSKLKSLNEQLIQLESSVDSTNVTHIEDIKNNIEINEKNRSENIARTEETKNIIAELDTASKTLKQKIEENLVELTNTKYSLTSAEN
ncbi:MAG TPA: hypothetical protein VIP56_08670 [Nitrososphaeraceae archaeon]